MLINRTLFDIRKQSYSAVVADSGSRTTQLIIYIGSYKAYALTR
jgi:hypothetical protein